MTLKSSPHGKFIDILIDSDQHVGNVFENAASRILGHEQGMPTD